MNNDGIVSMDYCCGVYLMEKGWEINAIKKLRKYCGVKILL